VTVKPDAKLIEGDARPVQKQDTWDSVLICEVGFLIDVGDLIETIADKRRNSDPSDQNQRDQSALEGHC
jgi:hypothetical protein